MAGSTFQPPIHLDPSQDSSQQTSFVNQNFQAIASTLETNSFRIVAQGNTSITPAAAQTTWVTVPHNLGFAPIPFVYLNNANRTIGATTVTSNGNIPFPTWTNLSLDTTNQVVDLRSYLDCVADTVNLYIFCFNAQSSAIPTLTVQYYLVQQPAN